MNTPDDLEDLFDSVVEDLLAIVKKIRRRSAAWSAATAQMSLADGKEVFKALDALDERMAQIRVDKNQAVEDTEVAIELVALRAMDAGARVIPMAEIEREVRPCLRTFEGLMVRLVAEEEKLAALGRRFPAHAP